MANVQATIVTGSIVGQVDNINFPSLVNLGDPITGSYSYDTSSVSGGTANALSLQLAVGAELFDLSAGATITIGVGGIPTGASTDVILPFAVPFNTINDAVSGPISVDVELDGDDDTVVLRNFDGSGTVTAASLASLNTASLAGTAFSVDRVGLNIPIDVDGDNDDDVVLLRGGFQATIAFQAPTTVPEIGSTGLLLIVALSAIVAPSFLKRGRRAT